MLCDSCCAVTKEFCYHLQAYSPIQAPGSIGVPGDVGEDRLVYPADVTNGFQIDIEFVVTNDREFEVILFENLYPLLQDDSGIEHPSLALIPSRYYIKSVLFFPLVCALNFSEYSFLGSWMKHLRVFRIMTISMGANPSLFFLLSRQ